MSEPWTQHSGQTWPEFVKRVGAFFSIQKMDTVAIARALNSDEPTVCRALSTWREWRRQG